ncbi:hypothetical protein ACRALDRAFT_205560 [Sodiomyces alcalophilus JCM 7366]|uniref:uncharacterized protein n=1 Tax=Sodiomyces alcalophilus JCM 7366 TaxID=591952 RepID=UPI0039B3A532
MKGNFLDIGVKRRQVGAGTEVSLQMSRQRMSRGGQPVGHCATMGHSHLLFVPHPISLPQIVFLAVNGDEGMSRRIPVSTLELVYEIAAMLRRGGKKGDEVKSELCCRYLLFRTSTVIRPTRYCTLQVLGELVPTFFRCPTFSSQLLFSINQVMIVLDTKSNENGGVSPMEMGGLNLHASNASFILLHLLCQHHIEMRYDRLAPSSCLNAPRSHISSQQPTVRRRYRHNASNKPVLAHLRHQTVTSFVSLPPPSAYSRHLIFPFSILSFPPYFFRFAAAYEVRTVKFHCSDRVLQSPDGALFTSSMTMAGHNPLFSLIWSEYDVGGSLARFFFFFFPSDGSGLDTKAAHSNTSTDHTVYIARPKWLEIRSDENGPRGDVGGYFHCPAQPSLQFQPACPPLVTTHSNEIPIVLDNAI